ncbi:hypothetical protein SNE40_014262 [Patella caerulea]|uniref:Integrase core domain-containing protein n=1 Tax=Patella caerulea TaxID=87958 RepID=A0AAN8JFC1_PATCE
MEIALFLVDECNKSGGLHGYKIMYLKCLQEGYVVTRENVGILISTIAHDTVEQRKRRRLTRRVYTNLGPNFLWHVDGYDNLKPYGICVNGAIDGFSRYIRWLEAHITNSDPKLLAGYFMECIKRNNGCPSRVQTDKGTENNHIQQMQLFLRLLITAHSDYFFAIVLVPIC